MNRSKKKETIWRSLIFIILVTGLAFVGPLLGGSPSSPGIGFIIWGMAPMLVAVLMRAISRDWSDAGLMPVFKENRIWYGLAIITYPILMMLTLLIGAMISTSSISDFSILPYLKTAVTALPIFLIFAFFEEFGWRGYLVPKLASIGINSYLMHAIVGIVWATWHLPFVRELTWLYSSEDLLTFIPRLYLGAFAFSIFYDEIRLISGTFWPAVILHGISNSFGHPFVANYVSIKIGQEFLGSVGFDGLLMMFFFACLGVALKLWRTKKMMLAETMT